MQKALPRPGPRIRFYARINAPLRFLHTQPIRRKIIFASMIFVLPLATAIVWSAIQTVHEREAEVEEQAASIAAMSAAYLNQYLDGLHSLALALSKHPDVQALRESESNRLLAEMLKDQPLLINVMLVAPDGSIRASGMPLKTREPLHLPYLLKALATGQPVVGDLAFGRTSGRPSIALGYPMFDAGGTVSGVVALAVNLSRLQDVFASIPLPPGSVITLTDRSSRVLARSLDAERFIGSTVTSASSSRGRAGRWMTALDGVGALCSAVMNALAASVGIPQTRSVRALWVRTILPSLFFAGTLYLIWFGDGLAR